MTTADGIPRMTRERWARLAPLVDALLEVPPEQRQVRLAQVAMDDPALAAELTHFFNSYDRVASGDAADPVFDAAERDRATLLAALGDPDNLPEQLQAALAPAYVVEREIGGGGMSRVFVAVESGLRRHVVIKVPPSTLVEGISAERFAREIRLAASLQQANIVPVLAAGTAAGVPYYVMPFVEGRSLHERLSRDGPLPVSDAIGILRDVARALAYAHSRGVIHRDIKPGNILLSDRTAVVTDFGIAKALGAALAHGDAATREESVSRTGARLGTPAYIAPEQARGEPGLDHRADLYAFGCVAYELLTGQPPFPGTVPHEVIAAHLGQRPRPVSERRAGVPNTLDRLITACLEKDPALRPARADDVLRMLERAGDDPLRATGRRRRATAVLLTAAVVGGLAWLTVRQAQPPEPLTFAVVPFRNAAHDTALDYRSDGIGDEILNAMAGVRGVRIVGRLAAYRYKQRPGVPAVGIHEMEQGLGARLLLTGSLREEDGRTTLSVQLNDSTSDGELWSQSFTRNARELGSVTEDIARAVAKELRTRFGRRIEPLGETATAGTANASALDQYLIGQAQLRRRGTGVRESIQSFQRAIELDPGFARAHAALANALELGLFYDGTAPAAFIVRARQEARLALSHDSTLADAYVALGFADGLMGQWAASDSDMRRAIALDPDDANARLTFARQLIVRGVVDEAFNQLVRARTLEPLSPVVSAWLAYAAFLRSDIAGALAESERAVQLDSTLLPATNLGALIHLALGRRDAARQLVSTKREGDMTNGSYVFAKLGDTASAGRIIRSMEAQVPRPWFVDVARASVMLAQGDSADALAALERSSRDSGPMWVFFIPLGDPAYDLVRTSPRFRALLRAANVDSRVVENPRRRP